MATTRGLWLMTPDAGQVSVASRLGFDWLCLDAQHGRFDDAALVAAFSTRRDEDVPIWVRVRACDTGLIGRALDCGASGVIVPMVDTVEDARLAVSAALYPPRGGRSSGPALAAGGSAHPNPGVALMIETAQALDSVAEIAAVPGVTALFVGPFDLALSLGVTIESLLRDPALDRVLQACAARGLTAGAFGGTPERAAELHSLGYEFVAVATDELLLARGAAAALA